MSTISTKKQQSTPLLSDQISSFLKLLTQSVKDYNWNTSELQRLDKLSQDYLHKLELEDVKYKERAKIATQLRLIRQQRRQHKDSLKLLTPIYEFAMSPQGTQLRNLVNEKLGQTRREERKLGDKIYYFRILSDPPIDNITSK